MLHGLDSHELVCTDPSGPVADTVWVRIDETGAPAGT